MTKRLVSIIYKQLMVFISIKVDNPIKKWIEDLNIYFFKEDIQMAKRCMKRCSTLPIIRKMQIKTTMRYHLTPARMAITKKSTMNPGEDVERMEPSYTVGVNVSIATMKKNMEVP